MLNPYGKSVTGRFELNALGGAVAVSQALQRGDCGRTSAWGHRGPYDHVKDRVEFGTIPF